MSNKLMKLLTKDLKTDTNLETIRAYIISDDHSIQLTEDQARQKMIIDFADQQIRDKQGILNRYSIAQLISNRWGITHRSAQKYITLAEDLYSSSNPLNKKYKIQLRIERCEQLQQICIENGEYAVAKGFESEIREYIKMYPELKLTRTKRVQTYVLPGALMDKAVTLTQAEEILTTTTTHNDHSDAG